MSLSSLSLWVRLSSIIEVHQLIPIRIWKKASAVLLSCSWVEQLVFFWELFIVLIMAAANLAITVALSPLLKGSWTDELLDEVESSPLVAMAFTLTETEEGNKDEEEGSNEFFLPGWRPQAAIYVLEITLIFSTRQNSSSNKSWKEKKKIIKTGQEPAIRTSKNNHVKTSNDVIERFKALQAHLQVPIVPEGGHKVWHGGEKDGHFFIGFAVQLPRLAITW